ncbi:minor capsid protein [Clostridium perfringens]
MSKYSKDSKNYWIERTAEETWRLYNDLEENNKALFKFYSKAIEDINKEVAYLLSRVESGEITRSELYNYKRLMKLTQNMNNAMFELAFKVDNYTEEQIREAIIRSYKNINEALQADFSMNNDKLVEMLFANNWSGEMFSERIWSNTGDLAAKLNMLLKEHLIRGSSIAQITKLIHSKLNAHLKNTLRVVRTETMHYLNAASLQSYKDAGVEEVEMLAAKDERLCEVCGSEHGKIYPINEAPILPLHPNCRCTIVPVVHISKGKSKPEAKKEPKGWHENNYKNREFKNKAEIKKHLLSKYGIKFSDSRKYPIDQAILTEAVNWLDKFTGYFEGFERVRKIELPALKVKPDIGAVGYYKYSKIRPISEEIALNANMFRDINYMRSYIKKATNINWISPKDGATGTFVHEYGHYIAHNLFFLEKDYANFEGTLDDFERAFMNDVIKEYNKTTGANCSFKDTKELLSEYGASMPGEAFAEAFGEYFGSSNPREFAKIFGKKVEETLKSYL